MPDAGGGGVAAPAAPPRPRADRSAPEAPEERPDCELAGMRSGAIVPLDGTNGTEDWPPVIGPPPRLPNGCACGAEMPRPVSAPGEESGVRASQSPPDGSEAALLLDETSGPVALAEVPTVREGGTIARRPFGVEWLSAESTVRSPREAWSEGLEAGASPGFRLPIKPMGRPMLRAKRLIGSVTRVLFSIWIWSRRATVSLI